MNAVRMERIEKAFAGVPALRQASLEVEEGQVHALMGENGAGKSTLMKILSGLCQPDAGSIMVRGKPVRIDSPKHALDLGISMIHQELNPVRAMSVSSNIFLGKEPCYRLFGMVNRQRQRALTRGLLDEMELAIDPDTPMGELSVAEMQMVEIVKAVSDQSRIIIMDEPTSALADREVTKLFGIIRKLKAKGIAIIYISHKMDEIFRIADAITVMRDGVFIESRPAAALDRETLIRLMVGRSLGELFPPVLARPGDVTLEVDGLGQAGVFRNIEFSARRGEILGFAGLMGAGRSQVMEAIFGLRRIDAGRILRAGKPVKIHQPAAAIRQGIAFITEDRQATGLNLKGSVRSNLTLVVLKRFSRFGQWLSLKREKEAAAAAMRKLDVRARDLHQTVGTLSGGNQQKIVLAKWLENDPDILILDEPTRGIDIGAKAEIYKIIAQLAEAGKTILLISSELEEILGLCHRVIVLHQGEITGRFDRAAFSQETIMKAAMGGDAAFAR
jgi:inositol transport system ATP-binding protein